MLIRLWHGPLVRTVSIDPEGDDGARYQTDHEEGERKSSHACTYGHDDPGKTYLNSNQQQNVLLDAIVDPYIAQVYSFFIISVLQIDHLKILISIDSTHIIPTTEGL